MRTKSGTPVVDPYEQFVIAVDKIARRMKRIVSAFEKARVPYALVGGQAVALWVATIDPAAVRVTKDVDLLLSRDDLTAALAAASKAKFEYFEVLGVGMFLERADQSPKSGVHIVWAGEKVRPEYLFPAPAIEDRVTVPPGRQAVSVEDLVVMKLQANRDHDRVHLRDMIDVGLIDRKLLKRIPPELADRLEPLLKKAGK